MGACMALRIVLVDVVLFTDLLCSLKSDYLQLSLESYLVMIWLKIL